MPGSGRAEGESGVGLERRGQIGAARLPAPLRAAPAFDPCPGAVGDDPADHATIAGGRGQDQLRPSMWMMWTSIGHASVGLAPVLIVLWPVRAVASDGFDHPFSYRSLRFPFEVGFEHHDGTTRS